MGQCLERHLEDCPTLIAEDNQGAIAIAENSGMRLSRTKHVGVDVHFIQAEIESNKTIQLVYCQAMKMVADILTKTLIGIRVICEICVGANGKVVYREECSRRNNRS